jgi:hypothetical protein
MNFFKVLLGFLVLLSGTVVYAQDKQLDSLDLSFESTPVKEEAVPYFAIAGGFVSNFFFANFNDLNAQLSSKNFGVDNLKGSVFMAGGEGFTAIGIIPNLRIGFFGMGGSKTSIKSFGDTTKSVDFDVSFNGVSFDYAIVPLKKLAILPGVNLGWGRVTIENNQTIGSVDWPNFNPAGSQNLYLNRIEANMWLVQPHLDIEYAVTPFFAIRVNGGYSASFMGSWKYNNSGSIEHVPTGINGSGLYAGFGVFLGLFNY